MQKPTSFQVTATRADDLVHCKVRVVGAPASIDPDKWAHIYGAPLTGFAGPVYLGSAYLAWLRDLGDGDHEYEGEVTVDPSSTKAIVAANIQAHHVHTDAYSDQATVWLLW